YSALNKDVDLPGIYEFTALGLLDDREIDYYNSKELKKIPKQSWMMEKMQEDYWEKGTQSRKSKEMWFKVNLDILMQRMNHSNTDLHVLQWRHEGIVGVRVWVASVQAAELTKRKWDGVAILNQYTQGYLEKECVDWLKKFMDHIYCVLNFLSSAPPAVHMFAKKSVRDSSDLTLTCLITGFYPKHVKMSLRKFSTEIPDHLITSSGIRPNHNGTYQLRKSVEIQEDDPADYYCYVSHSSLTEPLNIRWVYRIFFLYMISSLLLMLCVCCVLLDVRCPGCTNKVSLVLLIAGAILGVGLVVLVLPRCLRVTRVLIWRIIQSK
uniref:Ig-like domain-containing protein n=1 Tax=Astyanax mexicanus TaxID=7994 RepID=A0A3B1IFZ6_ASTMX